MEENTEGLASEDHVEDDVFELHPVVTAVFVVEEGKEEETELLFFAEKLNELFS